MQKNTDPRSVIAQEITFYDSRLKSHPISGFCESATLPREVLHEFVRCQYVDSALWVTMLSLAKGQVQAPKLREAIVKNIICETGINGTPHITLCKKFVESVGLEARFGDHRDYAPATSHAMEVMNAFDCASDGLMAGWLLVAETMVPTLFSLFRPAFREIHGADLRYLDEHISVDADEHALWMMEAAAEISATAAGLAEVTQGISLGGRTLLSVPDALWAKSVSMSASAARRLH